MYGLCYTTFIGDGGSSVHGNLVTGVPVWGFAIKSSNHAIKCYRSSLKKLVQQKPKYKGKGRLSEPMRRRLTKPARCAIKMRSAMLDKHLATELLRQGLRNGPLHCFGIHAQCSTDYYYRLAQKEHLGNVSAETWADASSSHHAQDTSSLDTCETSLTDDNTPEYIAARESRFWEDAVNENNLDDIYMIASQNPGVDPEMIWDI